VQIFEVKYGLCGVDHPMMIGTDEQDIAQFVSPAPCKIHNVVGIVSFRTIQDSRIEATELATTSIQLLEGFDKRSLRQVGGLQHVFAFRRNACVVALQCHRSRSTQSWPGFPRRGIAHICSPAG